MDAAQLHLGFSAGGEALSVPAFQVAEVARVPACTRVPNAPAALVGLASLRGIVLPVVSLAVLLGRTQAAATAQSRLLVVAGAAPVGVLVDQVTSLGATGGGRDPDIRALLDAAFAGLRRRPAAVPATLPGARPDEAPGPAQAAAPLALVGLLVAGQEYALRLHDVSAILRLPAARAHVPGLDAAMLGVMPYEGGTLPLVSLAALLGLPDGIAAATRVVVTAIQGMRLGLVVDAVTGTLALPPDAIGPVPAVLTRGTAEATLDGICRLDGGARLAGLLCPARLFDADTLARLQDASRGEAASPAPAAADAGPALRFVLFRLGDEQYGLPLAAVDEVVRRPPALTWLPHGADFLLGMMALRGRSVPVLDMARRFGSAPAGDSAGRVVVVVSDAGLQAGLAVDGVSDILQVQQAALQPAPASAPGPEALFDRVALRHDGRALLLISPRNLLVQAGRDLRGEADHAASPAAA